MIEFDTQIIPTARAMSFLFFWARSAFKVRKEFYVTYEPWPICQQIGKVEDKKSRHNVARIGRKRRGPKSKSRAFAREQSEQLTTAQRKATSDRASDARAHNEPYGISPNRTEEYAFLRLSYIPHQISQCGYLLPNIAKTGSQAKPAQSSKTVEHAPHILQ